MLKNLIDDTEYGVLLLPTATISGSDIIDQELEAIIAGAYRRAEGVYYNEENY